MIPGIPVFHLLVGVQAVNGILLPITLYFVWRLSASAELMGKYRNGRIFNVVAGATVIATSALSLILLAVTLGGPVALRSHACASAPSAWPGRSQPSRPRPG